MNTALFRQIQEYLIRKFNPVVIIVFGSYAKGSNRQDSDIDIAIFCKGSSPSTYELFIAAQELADQIKIDVDLVNLMDASTVFKAQIYTYGLVIYSADDNFLKEKQMTALSMYARLNEERKGILDKIKESGSIYGK